MTLGGKEKAGVFKQRGFWLRCFLGFFLTACFAPGSLLWAKVEPAGPLHLWRLHGFFMSAAGKPFENVEVLLVRDGVVRYRAKTDAAGQFAFDHVYGRYSLQIEKTKDYSQLAREVTVGEAVTMLHRNTLYVIAGPGACTDDCSSVFTSKSEFENAVRKHSKHQD